GDREGRFARSRQGPRRTRQARRRDLLRPGQVRHQRPDQLAGSAGLPAPGRQACGAVSAGHQAGGPDPDQRAGAGLSLCLHRDRLFPSLGSAERHQPDPRLLHRARGLSRVRSLQQPAHLALVRRCRRRPVVLRARLWPAAIDPQPRHHGAGA
ncbi:hypothetical protein KXV85_004674, partial [Aspergillus fumigatus]